MILTYLIVSLILSAITIEREQPHEKPDQSIYLTTNGVHLDIILPKQNIDSVLLSDIIHKPNEKYLAFAWGDQNFYLNTPKWADLTFDNAFRALFLKSSTLVHITRYQGMRNDWVEIKISASELKKLNTYILGAFVLNKKEEKIVLKNEGYTSKDNFYKAKGSYSLFKTSNTWVNTGFKKSGLKACLWTPFDFALMNKYE